jgi:hypothetical protein
MSSLNLGKKGAQKVALATKVPLAGISQGSKINDIL